MVGEFEDYAMLREFARIGIATGVEAEFYAISVERKIRHPAVAAMTDNAGHAFLRA